MKSVIVSEAVRKHLKAVPLLPFKIKNRSNFIFRNHPIINYYQDSESAEKYKSYWLEQLKRVIEGYWGVDSKEGSGPYRYMPGNLYFYVNLSEIKKKDPIDNSEITEEPELRDVEWFIGYDLLVCSGFSGFDEDHYRSSNHLLGKLHAGIALSPKEKITLERQKEFLVKPDGTWKTYVEPIEALYGLYEKPVGKPLFMNQCEDLLLFSSRRVGKTYTLVNCEAVHPFVTNGARSLQQFYDRQRKATTTVVVGSYVSEKSTEFMTRVDEVLNLLRVKHGAFTYEDERGRELTEWGAFYHPYEGSTKVGHKLVNSVKAKSGKGREGAGSQLVHITWQNNISAGVGHGASRILLEEVGLTPSKHFEGIRKENDGAMKRDGWKYGFAAYIGTGGDVKKTRSLKKAFFNPTAKNIRKHKNLYGGKSKYIASFISAAYFDSTFRDSEGNQRYEEAFEEQLITRQMFLDNGDVEGYQGYCVSFPLEPNEMFEQQDDSAMPKGMASIRMRQLEDMDYVPGIGSLEYVDTSYDKVKYIEELVNREACITSFDHTEWKDKRSKILVYEPPDPRLINKEVLPNELPSYLTLYDSVLKDGEGSSLCHVLVVKLWDDIPGKIKYNVVAEWYGRYMDIDDNHKQAFMMATWYNSKLLPEVNINDVVRYANRIGKYKMLEKAPRDTLSKIVRQSWYDVGMRVSPGMIATLENYLISYLLAHSGDHTSYIDENGNYVHKPISNLLSTKSKLLCDAISAYDRDENNDIMSTWFMFATWLRDRGAEKQETSKDKVEELLMKKKKMQMQIVVS